jgi:hypothetical protein
VKKLKIEEISIPAFSSTLYIFTSHTKDKKKLFGDMIGDNCMLFLKKCPECHSELENNLFKEFQYCPICGYWTRKETARLEPLIILE